LNHLRDIIQSKSIYSSCYYHGTKDK